MYQTKPAIKHTIPKNDEILAETLEQKIIIKVINAIIAIKHAIHFPAIGNIL